jgi:integrase
MKKQETDGVGVYSDGIDSTTGKIIKRNIYAKTRQEIVERLNVILYEKANSTYIKKNEISLIAVINNMIERKYKANIIADRQYRTLKAHAKKIGESNIAKMNVQKITTADVQNYLYSITDYSQSYIRKLISLLNNAFNDLVNKRIININPMNLVIIPKSKKEKKVVRALTLVEQKKLTDYLINSSIYDEPYKNIFLIQMYLGLRIGETLTLCESDFEEDYSIVHIRKTLTEDLNGNIIVKNKTKTYAGKRDLIIPNYLKPYIIEQIEISKHNKDGLLFTYRNNYVRHHSVNSVLKRIFRTNLALSDNGISTHVLRHTYATRCKEASIDLMVASQSMGHSEISMTLENYTEIQEAFKKEELKKLNEYIENKIEFKPKNN